MRGGSIYSNITVGGGYAWGGGGIYVTNDSTFIKRATPGNSTSGIIYGATGDGMANSTYDGSRAAIYRENGAKHNVNATLGQYDEISSLTDDGWE
jgi:hypothetical protein